MPAILTPLRADAIRVTHEDVHYEPVASDAALGALLFALDLLGRDAVDVAAMRYADRLALGPALDAARQYGLILQRHVDRADRSTAQLPPSVQIDAVHAWVHAAAATVPEAEPRSLLLASSRAGSAPIRGATAVRRSRWRTSSSACSRKASRRSRPTPRRRKANRPPKRAGDVATP